MRSILLVLVVSGAVGTAAPGAGAATDVTVTLQTAPGAAVATHGAPKPEFRCALQVPQGSNGVVVLDKAKATGCITSYAVTVFSFGTFLDCIDGVCGGADPKAAACWYWSMHENGPPTSYGVDGFRADQGDVLSFVFVPWGAPAAVMCP